MSWHSGVICGNQGLKRGRPALQMDAVTVSRVAREGWRESCARTIPSSRVPGVDLIMLLGLPLTLQRVLPTLETNLVHGGDEDPLARGTDGLGRSNL